MDEVLKNYTIKKVVLELFLEKLHKKEDDDPLAVGVSQLFHKDWNEESVTWLKQSTGENWDNPSGDVNKSLKTGFTSTKVFEEGVWFEYDITTWEDSQKYPKTYFSAIERMVNRPDENFGIRITLNDCMLFRFTSCQGDNSAHYPRLRVTVEETVSIISPDMGNINSSVDVIERDNKFIFSETKCDDIVVNMYSLNGRAMPVQLTQVGNDVIACYNNLLKGVYVVIVENKVTKQNISMKTIIK